MSFEAIPGSSLPLATSVSDSDVFFIIQGGQTKILPKSYVGGGSGGGGDVLNAVVDASISSSGSLVLEAGTLISKIVITGSAGTFKIGTTAGNGEIIDDSFDGTPVVFESVGKYFETATTIYFTGTFNVKLLLWLL